MWLKKSASIKTLPIPSVHGTHPMIQSGEG
jgi:hypothetical protein